MERILHFVTVPRPTDVQSQVIEIAKSLHPDWKVHVWRDPVDTSDFLLAHYHKQASNGAQLADLIRLDAVYRHGGIYLDSDIRLVRSLDILSDHENFFCSEDGFNLSNGAFGASKHCPAIRALIDQLLRNEPDWSLPANETTGPVFFGGVLRWRDDICLLPRETFYPYGYKEQPSSPLITTLGVHEWAASWTSKEDKSPRASIPRWKAKIKGGLQRAARWISPLLALVESEYRKHNSGRRPSGGNAYSFGVDQIAVTNRGIRMSLPGHDLSITPEIALFGSHEEREIRFIENNLKGGDFFVDVGCNIGVFTLTAARIVGPFGRVFAFDPNDEVTNHLRRSLVMNWVHDRVRVFENAVGVEAGKHVLRYSKLRLGEGNLDPGQGTPFEHTISQLGDLVHKEVSVVALDGIFRHTMEIKVLKIDAEGFEYAVLKGARRLFEERSINFAMVELLEEMSYRRYHLNLDAVQDVIRCGYRICTIDENGKLIRTSLKSATVRRSMNIVLERE